MCNLIKFQVLYRWSRYKMPYLHFDNFSGEAKNCFYQNSETEKFSQNAEKTIQNTETAKQINLKSLNYMSKAFTYLKFMFL